MKLQLNSKTFLLLILLLFGLSPKNAQAQTVLLDPPEIYIGTTHGVNMYQMLFKPRISQDYAFGYNGGISFRYITEKHFGLQVELNYSQRGWQEEIGKYTRQFDYIELPFLTHFYAGDTHRFIFNLGPKVSYLFNETILNTPENPTEDQHIAPIHFRFDYGVAAGLGYNLHTKRAGVFQLEIRGYYGLSDVFANSKSDYFDTSNHFNAAVNIGWFFQLTGRK